MSIDCFAIKSGLYTFRLITSTLYLKIILIGLLPVIMFMIAAGLWILIHFIYIKFYQR